MKVLQINAVYGFGSTGIIVRDIQRQLEKEGHECSVAYQSASADVNGGYRVGTPIGWKMHAFLSRLLGKQAYFSRHSTKKLLKYIDEQHPDIVHLHNLHSNYIHLNILLRFLAERNIHTVITMHDCWYFTGKCFHYADVGCDKWRTECGDCPKKGANPPTFFFDKSTKTFYDRKKYLLRIPSLTIVGCSDWISNEARNSFLSQKKIARIRNGTDIDVFKPYDTSGLRGKYGIGDKCFVIMGMANKWLLPENKLLFEKAATSLSEKSRLMLVGCKESEVELLKKINNPYIIAVEHIDGREELARHYSMADVFVNATYADTLPTVNMESICCATPVVTYDGCGSAELVLDGCGTVVKRGDAYALLSAAYGSTKIAQGALDAAREVFDKNRCYEEYVALYKDILKE